MKCSFSKAELKFFYFLSILQLLASFLINNLWERSHKIGKNRERFSNLLIHSPNDPNSQVTPGWNWSQELPLGLSPGWSPSSTALAVLYQELGSATAQVKLLLIRDAGVASGGLSSCALAPATPFVLRMSYWSWNSVRIFTQTFGLLFPWLLLPWLIFTPQIWGACLEIQTLIACLSAQWNGHCPCAVFHSAKDWKTNFRREPGKNVRAWKCLLPRDLQHLICVFYPVVLVLI